jgi:ribosomal protein L32
MRACPACGSVKGYTYKDPGVLVYKGKWGEGRDGETIEEVEHHLKRPTTALCLSCGEVVSLNEARRNR